MSRYVMDTNHVSAMLEKNPILLQKTTAIGKSEFSVTVPSIAELWFMVFNSTAYDRTLMIYSNCVPKTG